MTRPRSRAPARKTPEGAVLRACLKLLDLWGIPAWRQNTGMLPNPEGRPVRFGIVGGSDIIAVLPPNGRIIACECKAPGKESTLTPDQWAFLDRVHRAGGVAIVVSDVGRLARVLAELAEDPGRACDLPPRPKEKKVATTSKRRRTA